MSKLILCAGDRRLEGYKHHDVRPLEGLDYVCEFFSIPETIKERFSEVHLTHALEHFPTKETQAVLKIISDLLEPGGKFYIEVPNFAWHAELLLFDKEDRKAVYYAFGGQLDQYDFHKTGFTKKILEEELALAGFERVDIKNSSSLSGTAYKK